MFTIVRRSVVRKIYVPAAKVKVTLGQISDKKITRDDNISRYFPDIAQSISPICISVMSTSLSKASVTVVYCDNVALVFSFVRVIALDLVQICNFKLVHA
jgi:hypothetical protein